MEFGFGSGIMTGIRTDTNNNTPMRVGALQDVSVEFNGEIKELFATQQFAIDVARGKTKITGKAKFAEIKGRVYNDLFFGQTLSTGGLKFAYNESTSLSTTTVAPSYTVANAGSTPLADQGVFYVSNGNQLTSVGTVSAAGQYIFVPSTGVYTFGTFDNGLGMFVNYTYTTSTGVNIGGVNPLMGNTPQFQITLFQAFEGNQVTLTLYKCVSTRLTFPTRIDDYVISDLDFSAFANAAGSVFNWATTN